MVEKYILGVAHNEGQEVNALDILKKYSRPGDLVAIETEYMTAKVVINTIDITRDSPEKLKEILHNCNVPFSFYWGNLIRLSYINNLGLKFLALENRKVLENALPLLEHYERRKGNMGKKKLDEFIVRYIFDRESSFDRAVKIHNPHGIIVGAEHLDFFSNKFPEYRKVYEYKGELSIDDFLSNRINVLRKRNSS